MLEKAPACCAIMSKPAVEFKSTMKSDYIAHSVQPIPSTDSVVPMKDFVCKCGKFEGRSTTRMDFGPKEIPMREPEHDPVPRIHPIPFEGASTTKTTFVAHPMGETEVQSSQKLKFCPNKAVFCGSSTMKSDYLWYALPSTSTDSPSDRNPCDRSTSPALPTEFDRHIRAQDESLSEIGSGQENFPSKFFGEMDPKHCVCKRPIKPKIGVTGLNKSEPYCEDKNEVRRISPLRSDSCTASLSLYSICSPEPF